MLKKVLFVFLLVFAGVLFFAPIKPVLSISSRKNNSEKYFISTARIEGFEIAYTHSVNKGRVHDFYDIKKSEGLLLTGTRFVSYGAGIPEPEEMPGCKFLVTEDGYEIVNINRELDRLVMAVGLIANHTITFWTNKDDKNSAGHKYKMADLFPPQTSIILEKKRVSLLSYIFHKLKVISKNSLA